MRCGSGAIAALALLLSPGCADLFAHRPPPEYVRSVPRRLSPAPGKARIVFVRGPDAGDSGVVQIVDQDSRLVTELAASTLAGIDVDPGDMTFVVAHPLLIDNWNSSTIPTVVDGLRVQARADETYYVKVRGLMASTELFPIQLDPLVDVPPGVLPHVQVLLSTTVEAVQLNENEARQFSEQHREEIEKRVAQGLDVAALKALIPSGFRAQDVTELREVPYLAACDVLAGREQGTKICLLLGWGLDAGQARWTLEELREVLQGESSAPIEKVAAKWLLPLAESRARDFDE